MATKNEIENLKAALDALKQEKADIEARLDAAALALHDAEREARRREKLTPAMRKALVAMANGSVLLSSRFHLPESYWLQRDCEHETVRRSVFLGLRTREAIDSGERDGTWRAVYRLTEHGKSLVAQEGAELSLQSET